MMMMMMMMMMMVTLVVIAVMKGWRLAKMETMVMAMIVITIVVMIMAMTLNIIRILPRPEVFRTPCFLGAFYHVVFWAPTDCGPGLECLRSSGRELVCRDLRRLLSGFLTASCPRGAGWVCNAIRRAPST